MDVGDWRPWGPLRTPIADVPDFLVALIGPYVPESPDRFDSVVTAYVLLLTSLRVYQVDFEMWTFL